MNNFEPIEKYEGNWNKYYDPQTKHHYFFNSMTQESTWLEPPALKNLIQNNQEKLTQESKTKANYVFGPCKICRGWGFELVNEECGFCDHCSRKNLAEPKTSNLVLNEEKEKEY